MSPLATTEEGPSRSPIKSSQRNEEAPSKVHEFQSILQSEKKSKKTKKKREGK
jgi:hypothetical protein